MAQPDRPAVVILGAPFSWRTLHPTDGRWRTQYNGLEEHTLDRIETVTLAAVAGLRHRESANMEVFL